jgi:hypothetical protein
MTTATTPLPKSLKEFIDHQLVEALLLEGLATGDDVPLTPAFWTELKTEVRQIAAKHTSQKQRP